MVKICFDDDCEKIDDCLHCQKNALIICFLINLAMFALELFYGLRENSASLLGDAAHNSGDALILGSSLFVMASTLRVKAKLALIKSFIMLGFGLLTFYHVCLVLYAGTVPHAETLTAVGTFALTGNIVSALLLMYYRNKLRIIDSQDALIGNPVYDLVSLIDDVRIKTPNKLKITGIILIPWGKNSASKMIKF